MQVIGVFFSKFVVRANLKTDFQGQISCPATHCSRVSFVFTEQIEQNEEEEEQQQQEQADEETLAGNGHEIADSEMPQPEVTKNLVAKFQEGPTEEVAPSTPAAVKPGKLNVAEVSFSVCGLCSTIRFFLGSA